MRTVPRYKKNSVTGRDIAVGVGTAALTYFIGIPLVLGILVIGALAVSNEAP
jgi:hypothetical protein